MPRFDPTTLTSAAIHVAENREPPAAFAAAELQRYLQRMTGARPPIVADGTPNTLVLGDAVAPAGTPAPPQPGSFIVTPETSRITLHAGSPRALLSAVYALLQQLGCRWSLHGLGEEIVPRVTEPIEIEPVRYTPRFDVHGYCSDIMTWHYTQPEYLADRLDDDRAFIDWMGKSGANAFFFIRHPFDTQLTIPQLLPEFQRRGIDIEYGGHVMPLLLPRELYREHPEYFPAGPDGTRTDHGNLCTSNPAALATASANAVQYVRDYPEMHVVHIWGADLWQGGWCRCAACAPLSVQDQSLRVCNAVARGLAEAGVARPVCYLAYHDTIDANLTLRPDDNVIVEFAPRERCYGHALNHPDCGTNRPYAAALERYVKLFAGRVRVFEYYGDAILFFGCAVPLTQVIAADLEYYRHLGVPGITMLQFGLYSGWAYPLNFLAFARGVGGASRPDDLARSYCRRFGVHAGTASALFKELEDVMRPVVTYGDLRRPPRPAEAAARTLVRVEAALPRLAGLAQKLAECGDQALGAQAALVRYTHAVLRGVQAELRSSGRDDKHAQALYTAALEIIAAVDRHFKGLWGQVDLPIVHSFYTVA